MLLTSPAERALEDLDTQLAPVRKQRERVIALVQQTIGQVSAAKSWMNPQLAAADCRQAFRALDDYRGMVGQMELSLAMSGGNRTVEKMLADLHISNHGSEIDVCPLYRILGQEADQRAAFERIERILKSPSPRRRDSQKAPATRVYKLKRNGRIDVAQRVNWTHPAIDEAALSATFTINTDAVDREGELILPSGVDFTDYRKNPVVLFEHGLDPAFPTPIGRCETPDGKLAVEVNQDSIRATCFFIRDDADSMRVWNLVRNGAIRAASIHVNPTVPSVRRVIDGVSAKIYPQSSMIEWSLGRIGVNQEATI